MDKVTCDDCGHINPHGTILCESCGKPLQEDKTSEILTMRYEGSARRSQTYKKTPIDKIWNLFSSVKVGVTLIVLTFIALSIGTVFPQKGYIPPNVDKTTFYQDKYGTIGKLYQELGFDHLYGSWWFILLIGLLGLSIIIASIDRGVPLYRALKNQRVSRNNIFLKRQRVFSKTQVQDQDDLMAKAKKILRDKHYRIREEDGNLFAEKHRFARWGAYVNHTGLIIVMVGAMLRFFPGMYFSDSFWIKEGVTKPVSGTNGEYYIKNDQFILETYSKDNKRFGKAVREEAGGQLPKNYQTNVTLYKRISDTALGEESDLKKIKKAKIQVNHPLKVDGFTMYQVDFQTELGKMTFNLVKKSTGKSYGQFTVDLFKQKSVYTLKQGYKVELLDYFPDFYFNDKNEPATRTPYPNNPTFIFKMFTPETPKGEVAFIGIRKNIEPFAKGANLYKISFAGVQTDQLSALSVHKDKTLWILIIGGILFMIGVVQGLYWQYRRIWLKRNDREIWCAGTTNKNWFGLKKEMSNVANEVGLLEPVDKLEKEKGGSDL